MGEEEGGSRVLELTLVDELRKKLETLYEVVLTGNGQTGPLTSKVAYLEASLESLKKSMGEIDTAVKAMSSKLDKYVYLGVSTLVGVLVNVILHFMSK